MQSAIARKDDGRSLSSARANSGGQCDEDY